MAEVRERRKRSTKSRVTRQKCTFVPLTMRNDMATTSERKQKKSGVNAKPSARKKGEKKQRRVKGVLRDAFFTDEHTEEQTNIKIDKLKPKSITQTNELT